MWHDWQYRGYLYLMELVLAEHSQLLADTVLLKDGGYVRHVDARREDLRTQPVGHRGVVFVAIADLNGQLLQKTQAQLCWNMRHAGSP